jgi:SAM-dependent methyltransferase
MNKERLQKLNLQSYQEIEKSFDLSRMNVWGEFKTLTKSVQDGADILDLGCGNGRLLHGLPKVNFSYLGIDANAYLLSRARQRYPKQEFKLAKLEEVEISYQTYSHIYSIATFHHLVDRQDRLALLKKSYQALKPDGYIAFTVWNLWQPQFLKFIFKRIWWKLSWNDFLIPWKEEDKIVWRYYHGFTGNELRLLFTQAGFRDIDIVQYKNGIPVKRGYNYVVTAKK